MESLYEELVHEGIIVKYPKTNISDYLGEFRFVCTYMYWYTVCTYLFFCGFTKQKYQFRAQPILIKRMKLIPAKYKFTELSTHVHMYAQTKVALKVAYCVCTVAILQPH